MTRCIKATDNDVTNLLLRSFTMKQFSIIAITYVIFGKGSLGSDVDLSIPKNLIIGTGSAAYQIEGAWNVSGKSENIWDRWTHDNPAAIKDRSNGDIAANFYYKYQEDVQLIKSIGLDFFRFSIAWSRILPTGYKNVINKEGLEYYKNLTSELVANNIEPIVTLYHWDHPQILEEFGGWTNELMIDRFVSFAEIMFDALGDSVKIWTTFNEVNLLCSTGYDDGAFQLAPGKKLKGIGKYLCAHNMLKAHAKTYHMYGEKFRGTQQGEIGLALNCASNVPVNPNDTKSVETAFEFDCGWVYNPIVYGDYPEIMKTRIAMISKAQGYEESRLPEFSKEWVSSINGTFDYIGLNYYSSLLVAPDPDEVRGIYNSDDGLIKSVNSSWVPTAVSGLYVTPAGFGDILRQIRDKYNNPPVRVMENGYSDLGELEDCNRISYHIDHIKELLIAVKRDGCDVKSYSIWTLIDDFEWMSGYKPKFGIINVDFNDTDKPRTPRLSAYWLKSVLKDRKLLPVPNTSDSKNSM